jgi:adenylate kinase
MLKYDIYRPNLFSDDGVGWRASVEAHGDPRAGAKTLPRSFGPRWSSASIKTLRLLSPPVKVAISGTPGTGKSAAALVLAKRGHRVIEVSDFAKEAGLLGAYDQERDTYEVDTTALDASLCQALADGDVLLFGHLAHLLTVDKIIVLRTRPSVLAKRLSPRGYSEEKVQENVEAEACDVILIEAVERSEEVYEIDTTSLTAERTADAVEEILAGEKAKYAVGNIDWSGEVLAWF